LHQVFLRQLEHSEARALLFDIQQPERK
jgi:hypothetical protein